MTTQRPFATSVATVAGAAALLAFSMALAGCSHSTDDTAGSGLTSDLLGVRPGDPAMDFNRSRSLFPLAVGNYWIYRVRTHLQIIDPAAPPPADVEASYFINISGTATYDGRDYFLQSQGDPRRGGVDVAFPVRSSRFGLFHLELNHATQAASGVAPVKPQAAELSAYVDRTFTDPAKHAAYQRAAGELDAKLGLMLGGEQARTPPGATPDELTVLSYPLYVGARWVVRKDPDLARIVEARERINLPLGTLGAWRIRNTSPAYGPNDRVHSWYSNLGMLRLRVHAETNATDSTGAIIGRVMIDSDQALTDVHLVRGSAALVTGGNIAE